MPHVIVKLWPGRTEEQKQELANRIAKDVIETLNAPQTSVSVSIQEVPREKWVDEVYNPDIMDKEETLYIKPGYKPENL
ncbi:MAG TPA: 4-oxalocrotonate tautomerase [Hungateiclostridium thermocellum]|jgi:4-oxalocrotonate tautomerase|uniref:4-oxalocrotonate tautomerase n=2 Tax=Acetivibrio thermocellus TaxID=1515 RepID=A3DD58_ACET2|nr:tautomerase family protein [Acetivibrio thermocellus]CDG35345.1 hypothetical protein CTHBC1_0682 [Acetivibrio thermocellus BC1]HPU42113.1 tautomerase family protein [Acetivibrio clariflavus]ABN51887.1 4-oxalocrotonate tautomerase [Acetivibrio thermocellus ATCC 27405]ADU74634.1 4-oxalocrotonate tautomerase [Acetivibrio thermocellus DSM 1313]ALX08577.1 4-oxalocrotonate tautomerase [Acetivibrio thermocellus AD2]